MRYVIDFTILGTVFVYGLAARAVEPADAPARYRPAREGGREHRLRRTEPAAFKVPAMWEYSAPLIAPEKRESNPSRAQKDPTVVFYDSTWHVFMTVKLQGRSAIEHCSFKEWAHADASERTILKISTSEF